MTAPTPGMPLLLGFLHSYFSTLDIKQTHSTWHDTPILISQPPEVLVNISTSLLGLSEHIHRPCVFLQYES